MANTRGKRKENKPVDETIENSANTTVETIAEEITETTAEETTETVELKAPTLQKGVVNCQNLNVRKAPTTESTILRIIPKDTEVKILDDVNEIWYKIRIPEIETGFCMKEFISNIK